MPDLLASVLATEDDADLCTGLCDLLVVYHGDPFDPAAVPEEHRTVLLVWQTQGVIGNRGFNGFFAADLPGDPQYRYMRAAYDAVGCEAAAAAVRRVFDAFPGHTPPADPRARVQAFGRANHAVHGALNRDFQKAQEDLTAALAKYIREHAAAFAGIDRPGQRRAPVAAPVVPTGKPDPAAVGAENLPRWAQVAFSARCARQVFPLWEEAWPDAPPDYREAVQQAVVLAELSAADGKPVGDLKAAAAHATRVVQAAVGAQPGTNASDPPPAHPNRAGLIAGAAASALDLITGEDDTGSYGFAKGVTEDADRDDLLEDIQEDFQRIRQLSREGAWKDKTPVPPEVFDPTYKPKKTWWKVW
jgi:Domain of unknown function (DUF4375)